ncbi:MAG: Mrp/NBP35 family ATP-binding protein [Planctomycetota bacterium]|nr:Mrp/NBP35 family ATP-binding protein [Planctomycetaceae bacterium]MDQ3332517.1 Mrp/NBP35 family ATP-binding protein [Planctomycetota bacterium]
MSSPSSLAELRNVVAGVVDPIYERRLGELRLLKDVLLDGDRVTVAIELPSPGYPKQDELRETIRAAIQTARPDVSSVEVTFTTVVRGKDAGGRVGLNVKNIISVGSGKGGVGKSTVAACLTYGLKHFGAKVGLLDADVYGPSIPHMLGASGPPGVIERKTPEGQVVQRMVPLERDGIQLMSMGFLVKEEQAVIWRGPMLHKALQQFLQQTEWDNLDYLIIDLPPGTGDVSLTLSQLLGLTGAVVVCTPQKVARLDAVKAIAMFRQLNIPILGVVENMTGEVFGSGGAKEMAEQHKVPFLGAIPIEMQIRVKGDEGRIADLYSDDSPAREPLLAVCRNIATEIGKEALKGGGGPTLQIL